MICSVVELDDWYMIYLDGELVDEGHTLRPKDLLKLAHNCDKVQETYLDGEDPLEPFGWSGPKKLSTLLERYPDIEWKTIVT